MAYLKKFGQYIRKRRMETGMSLNQFCFENEIGPNTLSRYENGKREPKLSYVAKIAHGVGQTLGEFFIDFEKEQ